MSRLEDYFKKIGIEPIVLNGRKDVKPEHQRISGITDDAVYYDEYFKTDLDIFIESVDYHVNRVLFGMVLSEAKKFQDLFEPCCQSGIFGCYIATETNGSYKGIDINRLGIEKAKRFARLSGLSPSCFELGDLFDYNQEHEAIVGRCVVNGLYNDIRDDCIEALGVISKNIIIIQPCQSYNAAQEIERYKTAFNRHGFSFDTMGEGLESAATGAYMFVMKAGK